MEYGEIHVPIRNFPPLHANRQYGVPEGNAMSLTQIFGHFANFIRRILVLGESFIKAWGWFVDDKRDLRDISETGNELYKRPRYRKALC